MRLGFRANETRRANRTTEKTNDPKLLRMGLFTALAIAIHNFPEGLATFTAALSDPSLGISIDKSLSLANCKS